MTTYITGFELPSKASEVQWEQLSILLKTTELTKLLRRFFFFY
jgi:hypothetical protein